jgi:hypothetical protein
MTTFDTLMTSITELKAAEKVTKSVLGSLSRDLLSYLLETDDVRPVNRLLGQDGAEWILTPINHRIAVQYFSHFLPWKSNYDEVKDYAVNGKGERMALRFTKKSPKKYDEGVLIIAKWLADENNNLWIWSQDIKMDAKPKDFLKEVQKAVAKAMDKGEFSMIEIMLAIAELEEVTPEVMMHAIEQLPVVKDEGEQLAA